MDYNYLGYASTLEQDLETDYSLSALKLFSNSLNPHHENHVLDVKKKKKKKNLKTSQKLSEGKFSYK